MFTSSRPRLGRTSGCYIEVEQIGGGGGAPSDYAPETDALLIL